ncbi:Transcriptional regulator, GntR family [Photobacterium marinum]|uniref:Transcriptional regulator, GntR family n=1 Tax=Photobacterium marinum TaxID=1056511 RepID=L8J6W0_9GAMM|nr:FCD domain-containing protein [Photobacterium marinum]ELR63192.1 Transcriptional regulator, GntR family [Photobacterium marinum]
MKPTTITLALTEKIAQWIVSGQYAPEEQLPGENEIARTLESSRTSVRAALQNLAGKGMIIIQPKKRSTVAVIEQWNWLDSDVMRWMSGVKSSDRIITHLIATRLMFEPNIAALAALNATGRDLAEMEVGYEMMRDGRDNGCREQFNQGDIYFHRAIIMAAHNPFLVGLGDLLIATMELSFSNTLEDDVSLSGPALQEHWDVLEAIRLRNAKTARQRMREIVLASMRKVLPHDPDFVSLIH